MRFFFILLPVLLFTVLACSNNSSDNEVNSVEIILPDKEAEVETMVLSYSDFYHELVSNGKIEASLCANLYFSTAEIITHIWVQNGESVKKGQRIAELDKFRLNNQYVQMKDELERAKLELQDVLIGQGYSLHDEAGIPENILLLANVKSGYDKAYANYELAEYELENATLTAPFDGVVANLFTKTANLAATSEPFCSIIDNRYPEVTFTVLESEVLQLRKGDRITVSPFADKEIKGEGVIIAINPVVDANGMVKVKARLNNNSNSFFEGMNVRVMIQLKPGRELVIPKSALVLRSGKQVVFTCRNDQAIWKYVKTGLENSDSFTVTEGLNEGDTIIVEGNVNLAHESRVVVKK